MCVFDLLLVVVGLLVLLLSIWCYVDFCCLGCSGLIVVLFELKLWLVSYCCVAVRGCCFDLLAAWVWFAACGSGIACCVS